LRRDATTPAARIRSTTPRQNVHLEKLDARAPVGFVVEAAARPDLEDARDSAGRADADDTLRQGA
jgi:hypothetical protein